jgi:hypothetical protein
MEETFNELVQLVEGMKSDVPKWHENQTKAAGKRLRKNAMDIKKLMHQYRQEITEEINSL